MRQRAERQAYELSSAAKAQCQRFRIQPHEIEEAIATSELLEEYQPPSSLHSHYRLHGMTMGQRWIQIEWHMASAVRLKIVQVRVLSSTVSQEQGSF